MDRQELRAELSSAKDLLDTSSAAHLAYTVRDGTPRVVPVGYYWTGTEFVVATATTAPKVTALRRRPDVALTVDAGGTPGDARTLSVRGRAEVTIVDGVVEEYLLAARKSMSEQDAADFEAHVVTMYPQQARIAITPHWARFYDFGSGRMPKFLKDLAERSQS